VLLGGVQPRRERHEPDERRVAHHHVEQRRDRALGLRIALAAPEIVDRVREVRELLDGVRAKQRAELAASLVHCVTA
jgi:hypothetical protein